MIDPRSNVEVCSEVSHQAKGAAGGNRFAQAQQLPMLESLLRAHPAVADAVVRERIDSHGRRRVIAYARPSRSCEEQALRQHLIKHLESGDSAPDVVLVTRIACDEAGEVDDAALAQIEVLDPEALDQAEAQLRGMGVTAAALVTDRPLRGDPIPLGELLPPVRLTVASQGQADGAAAASAPLAIAHGGPLILGEDAPATLGDMLARAADRFSGKRVFHVGEAGTIEKSYAELLDDGRRIAGGLRRCGIKPGEQVLLQLENTAEFLAGFWGCVLGGFVPVPLAIASAYVTENAAVKKWRQAWDFFDHPMVLAGERLATLLRRLGEELEMPGLRVTAIQTLADDEPADVHQAAPDDLALLLLTSGSTGSPKAVMHTHRTLIASCVASCSFGQRSERDVTVNWMPLDHVGGIAFCHLREVLCGAKQVHARPDWVMEQPLRWLDLLHEHRATTTWTPNFAFALVSDQLESPAAAGRTWDLSALRAAVNAGEMIVVATARRFLRLLAPHGLARDAMEPAWGMSETVAGTTANHDFVPEEMADDGPASVGRAMPGFAMRIVDGRDEPLREGQIGRLQVRGDMITPGYYRDPARTEEAFTRDGWFITGDLARIDHGALRIAGREKDEIAVNGNKFSASEIESAIEAIEGVKPSCTAACAVRRGESQTDELAVFFVPVAEDAAGETAAADAIRDGVATQFALVPAYIVALAADELPRTGIGKIQRGELRRRLEAGDFEDRVSRTAAGNETVPQWFFEPAWSPRQLRDSELQSAALSDGEPENTALFAIEAGSSNDDSGDEIDVVLAALLTRIREAYRTGHSGSTRLVAFSRGPVLSPTAAAAAALLKTAARELPSFTVRHVHFADADDSQIEAMLAREVRAVRGAGETQVMYRDGRRYVRSLAPIDPRQARDASALTEGGRYLITGGLGGVGMQLASHLLRRFRAKLLLIGRSPAAAPTTVEALAKLRQLGDVQYETAAVEDVKSLAAAVRRAEAQWDATLSGAFHLAGVAQVRPLTEETTDGLRAAISPKLRGVRSLRKLLAERGGGLLVAFGAANAHLGGSGVGAYAAANAAMAALLASDATADGVDAHCLDWSMWSNLGMSRGYADVEATVAAGYRLIDAKAGLASMKAALRLSSRNVVIGLDASAPALLPHVEHAAQALRQLTIVCGNTDAQSVAALRLEDRLGRPIAHAIHKLPTLPLNGRGDVDLEAVKVMIGASHGGGTAERDWTETQRKIAAVFAEVLGVDRVGLDDSFLQLGGNSLMATQVISRLRPVFGTALTVRDLFEHKSAARLAEQVERRAAKPATDEDAGIAGRTTASAAAAAVVDHSSLEIDIGGLSDEQVTAMLDSMLASKEQA